MSDPFPLVSGGYDRIAGRYREWSSDSTVRRRWVDYVLDRLPADSLVLDLGCGSGEPATRLLAKRHRVIGIDGSAMQLRLARAAAPSAALVRGDITALQLRPAQLDTVTSFYALGHLPAAAHSPLLGRIATWLRPGGLLVANLALSRGG